ncbi:MAG: hypothetical protein AB1716_22440 [Planctomycetota bacterium]
MTTLHAPPVTAMRAEAPWRSRERRAEARRPILCDLWMIDHYGDTVLRCQCLEVSKNGMRLRVPLGYGVAEGQRYELRSHLPGSRCSDSLGLTGSRWATIVRTQLCVDGQDDHLDVGAVLDPVGSLTPLAS